MKYIWKKSTDIFSLAGTCFWQKTPPWRASLLQQTVQFGASLMTHLQPRGLPQHLTDRQALPRELPCAPPPSHATGIFPSSWSFNLAPVQKPTQSCRRVLSKL